MTNLKQLIADLTNLESGGHPVSLVTIERSELQTLLEALNDFIKDTKTISRGLNRSGVPSSEASTARRLLERHGLTEAVRGNRWTQK